jgi:hypothetical protein
VKEKIAMSSDDVKRYHNNKRYNHPTSVAARAKEPVGIKPGTPAWEKLEGAARRAAQVEINRAESAKYMEKTEREKMRSPWGGVDPAREKGLQDLLKEHKNKLADIDAHSRRKYADAVKRTPAP